MPEGSLTRIFDLIGEIKQNDARTDAMLADLRVVGADTDTPDPADFQPVITARVSGLQVELGWNWDGLRDHVDVLHIEVDRADGKGFVTLVHDTTPNYNDTAPFPATRTAWSYRGMWQVDGAPVGKWSETVSVVVGG